MKVTGTETIHFYSILCHFMCNRPTSLFVIIFNNLYINKVKILEPGIPIPNCRLQKYSVFNDLTKYKATFYASVCTRSETPTSIYLRV